MALYNTGLPDKDRAKFNQQMVANKSHYANALKGVPIGSVQANYGRSKQKLNTTVADLKDGAKEYQKFGVSHTHLN